MLAFHLKRLYNRIMNEAFHLLRLQKIDTQIDQIDARLIEIKRILESDATIQQAQSQANAANSQLDTARKALREREEQVKAQKTKIAYNEAALYGGKVRNPKELQDLQNEAAALKRRLAELEDGQLEDMLAVDEAEGQHKAASDDLLKAQAAFASHSATLIGEQSRLQKDRERLLAERQPIISQLPPSLIEAYERLRRQKRGIAVAGVVDGSCTACGATLTPGDWQAARSPNQITYCYSCGRILYAG